MLTTKSSKQRADGFATVQRGIPTSLINHDTPLAAIGKVEQQVQAYLNYCEHKKQRTPDTLKTKYYHIRQLARENAIDDLCKMTNRQLDAWCDMKIKDGMKPKSVNGHIDDLVGCLRFLKYKQELDISIKLEAVERYQVKEADDNEDLKSFTAREINIIKLHCKSLLEKLAFSMTFESAMRLHEITHLCVEDMKQNDSGKTYFRITGKGNKRRNTFVLPDTLALLEQWMLLAGIADGYIFPSPINEGRPYTREQMRQIISRPIRRAGYTEGGPHALRRSAITEALEHGMPLAKVTKWVGHADSRVTLRHYYRLNNERMQDDHQAALGQAFASIKV